MAKKNYQFEVETKEAGQRRAYGDGYYHYIIESENSKFDVKKFCTEYLDKAIDEKDRAKYIEKNGFGGHFAHGFTRFAKIADNKYEYKVTHPSTH